jgi:hypothetical protein
MLDERIPDDLTPDATPLDRRLHAIEPPPVPEDLLERCLATVSKLDQGAPGGRRRLSAWRSRVAAAAAAGLLIGMTVLLTRPGAADAAGLLQAVQSEGIKVAASHTVAVTRGPDGCRREETWYVRDRGRRQEIRVDDKPNAVVIRNKRWEFRWDIPGRIVAAWSTEMNAGHRGPNDSDGLVMDGDAMVRWATSHRAEVRVESDTVGGRTLRKIALNWPGPPSGGMLPRGSTIWFEPESLRPIKQRIEYDDGRSLETQMDYPAPDAVPEDLFTFRPPPDVTIEINDPDLGRQVYSEARTRTQQPQPPAPSGGNP